jgi:beta-xylosidase
LYATKALSHKAPNPEASGSGHKDFVFLGVFATSWLVFRTDTLLKLQLTEMSIRNFSFLILLFFFSAGAQTKKEYTNPILAGFYPDPSICKVGNDYYLVNSSFAYYPGLPLFHSKDLVSWKQIGNAMNRREQLNLIGAGVSRGLFAPTIRYYKGFFYIVCTLIDKGGNFVITAKDPAGSWSNPSWLHNVNGIDPSLFFDEETDKDPGQWGYRYFKKTCVDRRTAYLQDQWMVLPALRGRWYRLQSF